MTANTITEQLCVIAVNWRDIGEAQRAAIIEVIKSTADLNRQLSKTRPGTAVIDINELRKYLDQ